MNDLLAVYSLYRFPTPENPNLIEEPIREIPPERMAEYDAGFHQTYSAPKDATDV